MAFSMRILRAFSIFVVILGVTFGAVFPAPQTSAQGNWPERPLTIIVPFAAGGNTDGFARMAAQHLSESLGKAFVVENRPGAGGAIAAEFVAKAQPDGYTLFLAALPVMAVVPVVIPTGVASVTKVLPALFLLLRRKTVSVPVVVLVVMNPCPTTRMIIPTVHPRYCPGAFTTA